MVVMLEGVSAGVGIVTMWRRVCAVRWLRLLDSRQWEMLWLWVMVLLLEAVAAAVSMALALAAAVLGLLLSVFSR